MKVFFKKNAEELRGGKCPCGSRASCYITAQKPMFEISDLQLYYMFPISSMEGKSFIQHSFWWNLPIARKAKFHAGEIASAFFNTCSMSRKYFSSIQPNFWISMQFWTFFCGGRVSPITKIAISSCHYWSNRYSLITATH